ncbi:MAG: ATPase [Actinobacteria bacterium]|nr:ATPase [Actinomycetota bacterium]
MILGVDAGGTATRAVLVTNGAVVHRSETGPLNALLHADVMERLARLVDDSGAHRAGIGLPGLRGGAAARLQAALSRRVEAKVVVADDAEIARLGAFEGGPGIVVVAGTGSIALGVNGRGTRARAGGHGYVLGDEGGGYWIGREAVRAALRSRDGTGPSTRLETLLEERLGMDLDRLLADVYSAPADRLRLARLVPLVGAAAKEDEVADALLTRAADHLVGLARVLQRRLGPLGVAAVGGVFRLPAVRERFAGETGAVDPVLPPELGAVLLAQTAA